MKANSPLINFILGYCINPMILNTMMTHDEQNPDEQNPDDHTSIDEDRQTPLSRNPQSTPKKFFKAICLSWSLSVSKSVSDNFTYILVFCLSTLTKLTTNFGLGVLPLGLYMTPTRWGLPKPVPIRRNAWLAKTFQNSSYRPHIHIKKNDDVSETNKIDGNNKYKDYILLKLKCSGDIESNPGPIRVITYNCRSLKESSNCIRKKQQLIEYMRNLTSQVDTYIIMIQEVWIDDDKYFKNYWKGQHIFSPGTGKSRGCLTLLSDSEIIHIEQCHLMKLNLYT